MGKKKIILGLDIGGTGIKSGLVDLTTGKIVGEKGKVQTPQPSDTHSVLAVIQDLLKSYKYKGPVGCGFPAIMHRGVARSAANIDQSWLNFDIQKFFSKETGMNFYVANDADVAGLAEVKFGKAKQRGTVIVLTIGTGIGSAMFLDGRLIPNTELGHLLYRESIYEHYVSNSARKKENLTWEEWSIRFSEYLNYLEKLFSPDLFVLGGGASSRFDRFGHLLEVKTRVIPAAFENYAGVLGAAMFAGSLAK